MAVMTMLSPALGAPRTGPGATAPSINAPACLNCHKTTPLPGKEFKVPEGPKIDIDVGLRLTVAFGEESEINCLTPVDADIVTAIANRTADSMQKTFAKKPARYDPAAAAKIIEQNLKTLSEIQFTPAPVRVASLDNSIYAANYLHAAPQSGFTGVKAHPGFNAAAKKPPHKAKTGVSSKFDLAAWGAQKTTFGKDLTDCGNCDVTSHTVIGPATLRITDGHLRH